LQVQIRRLPFSRRHEAVGSPDCQVDQAGSCIRLHFQNWSYQINEKTAHSQQKTFQLIRKLHEKSGYELNRKNPHCFFLLFLINIQ